MRPRQRISLTLVALMLPVLGIYPTRSWGQEPIHIGDVVMVEGTAEVRPPEKEWAPIHLADPILFRETVRTHTESVMQALLLRDDVIWTLYERGEMVFTESLTPTCKHRLLQTANLIQGILRFNFTVVDREADVRTKNAVICVHGTTLIVIYDPRINTTEVIVLEGSATVQNLAPTIPGVESVPPNFRSRVVGAQAPTVPEEVPPAELEALQQKLRVTAQIPRELLPDERLPELPSPEEPVYEVGINPHTDAIEDPSASPSTRDFLESILDLTFDIPR